jgi:dipeptidyl aminopeptidase/acylaminoacyl peptidase
LWYTPELDGWVAGGTLGVVELRDGSLTTIQERWQHAFDIEWSRDGQTLFLIAGGGQTAVSSNQLWSVASTAGAQPRLVTPDVPFCISEIRRPADRDDLLVIVAAGVESEVHRFSATTGDLKPLFHFEGDLHGLSASADGETIGVLGATADRPLDLYAGSPHGPLHRVSDLHGYLDDIELGPQEVFTWERAGFTLDGILIFPPGKSRAGGPLPTIVSIHGGPYGRWPNGGLFVRFGRWLAQLGYLVFLPNPRGGMGHGNAFAESVLYTVGNDDYLDIMDGVDRLVQQGIADPERLACGGWSQGGFMTAWIVGHTDRFKAGIMGAGVSDWGMMCATSDIPSYETLMGGGNPYESAGPHTFDAQSPISYVHNAKTPTLIVHGEKDERVPVSQGIFMHRGLRAYNVPTELVVYPREPHGIQERNHQIDLAKRMADWYKQWLPVER